MYWDEVWVDEKFFLTGMTDGIDALGVSNFDFFDLACASESSFVFIYYCFK